MKIVRAPGVGKHRPACTHSVHMTDKDTTNRRWRLYYAKQQGVEPTVCGRPAMFLCDGAPRCQAHAGQDAVAYLMKAVD